MNWISKQVITIVAVGAVGTAACGVSRVQQCNKLIEKVNAAGTAVGKAGAGAGAKGNEMGDMAKSIDDAKTEIANVQLEDAKLKTFQQDYIKMLDKISTSAKAMQAASAKSDVAALQSGLKDIQTASGEETGIVNDLNNYCQGK